ncbi:hypothetical protein A6U87_24840 [Rhizobium sp. AC44/96]|uniref:hypothetical protein n=1 Tax=Rhizobium sp. AC44/96 TaxID=1841654 RepID=UPI000810070A|nr:hypothetical protein [Rhizobium sp. AC44/96]OCJ15072.1 hypothetical protein A6U87_24840 [Rhizobium sp. AC44/96]
MADFIAVIRRAVDGLTDNTPEMRVKVYERARGAVQRQLENMKPRPPEAMLQRQLEKLEAAIREVEAEHAVALPAEDDISDVELALEIPAEPIDEAEPEPAAAAPVAEVAPVEEPVHEQQAAYEEPRYEERAAALAAPAYEEPVYEEPVAHEEPAPHVEEPVQYHEEPAQHYHEAPADEVVEAQEAIAAEEVYTPPVHEEAPQAWHEAEPSFAAEPEPVEPWQAPHHDDVVEKEPYQEFSPEPAVEPHIEPAYEPAPQPVARDFDLSNRLVEPVHVFEQQTAEFVEHVREEPIHADTAAHFDPVWSEHAEEVPEPVRRDEPTDWALEELRQFSEKSPVAPANDAARAFEDVIAGIEHPPEPTKMPAANEGFSWEAAAFDDLPPLDSGKKEQISAHFDDGDLFSEVHGTSAAKPAPAANDAWQEATQLRGYDNRGVVAEDDDGISSSDVDNAIASKFQGKNFRMEPKRRRFGIGSIVTILIALGVVGGGGYAAWTNQAALTEMVKGLVSAAPSQTAKTETAPAKPDPATPASQAGDPAAANPPQKEVASLNDGSSVSSKFTQRLNADGTETDAGPAAAPGTQVAEGKSVAEQNVAASDAPPPVSGGTQPVAAPTPGTASAATPTADSTTPAATAPVGSSEKMFLYEERIGQSSPTAIQGSVVWSLQHEAGQDGKQDAVVRGMVTVPERNLSAQLTFKRNSDPSLPASHIVEIVFSLPPNFEGGAIDGVQRISMKRTEQDRGDALIAVPAKITDDFHMIALNDYPDARKANLDLLSNRDWLDIPITYRNGRRALLTMQKGTTGAEAFTAAIKEWAASGDVSTSQ